MNEIIHALGIQWSSLLAQAINFSILVFILAKFVYKPVLAVIDKRRAEIAESMEKAKEIDRQKEIIDQQRAAILRKADDEAGELLARAKVDAEALHAEIERTAKVQAAQIVTKGMQQLDNERAHMVKEIQDKLAHAIVKSAENILRREFSKKDQEEFEEVLKKNLPSMLA